MVAAVLALPPAAAASQTIELGLPIDCEIGKTCWVQQYFDHDETAGVRDYACGHQTYDGHDGTDIRIQDTSDEAAVVASAPGIVGPVRDGMDDKLIETDAERQAIMDKGCGNAVVIDHPGGWRTIYCHMRKGSVVVKKGDRVERGTKLGIVGYSGLAQFPHVHIGVIKGKIMVDPFSPDARPGACGVSQPLWSAEALEKLQYHQGDIIAGSFAPGAVDFADVQTGKVQVEEPQAEWPALVYFGWAINLREGDTLAISLSGPQGFSAAKSETLDRPKAQYFLFAGKKRPPGGWPPGEYKAEFTVSDKDGTRLRRAATAVIN
jgi:hypothetical protein